MLKLFSKKVKKGVGIASLACFLCMPISYTVSINTAAAASLNQIEYAERHNPPPPRGDNKNDRNDKWDNDKRPPRNDRDDKRDNDKRPPRNDRDDKWDNDKRPPRNDRDDRWDDKDKRPAPPPPRKDKKDDDKGYSKGNITTAVLIGGVIGAIIAKNT